MGDGNEERGRDAKSALVDAFSMFDDDALRDVWLFDQHEYEGLYVREDVCDNIADIDVSRFVDNERYGFVTRDTYSDLHYASYEYTVRGFDGYEQFRTFLDEGDAKVGVFASFDRRDGGYDFGALQQAIESVVAEYPLDAFAPE